MNAVSNPHKKNREYQVTCKPVRVYHGRMRLNIEEPFPVAEQTTCSKARLRIGKNPDIKSYNVSHISGGVLIVYNEKKSKKKMLICQLDQILFNFMQETEEIVQESSRLALSTVSMGFAIVAENFVPWLVPFSVIFTLYTARPMFARALKAALEEKKIKAVFHR